MPQALASLFELRSAVLDGKLGADTAGEALAFVERANAVLGVIQLEEESLDARVEALIEARRVAREAKDWAASDRIRDELAELKIVLQDTPEGVVWRRSE